MFVCKYTPLHVLAVLSGSAHSGKIASDFFGGAGINMNIFRANVGRSGNMWRDTTSKKMPRGENQLLCDCICAFVV